MHRPNRQQLIEAQLQVHPDSVIVDLHTVLSDWLNIPVDPIQVQEMAALRRPLYRSHSEALAAAHSEALLIAEHMALRNARGVILAYQHTPDPVFYLCGRRKDGTYAHRGIRVGCEPQQYISGIHPMN
jgi:hypothetical protein